MKPFCEEKVSMESRQIDQQKLSAYNINDEIKRIDDELIPMEKLYITAENLEFVSRNKLNSWFEAIRCKRAKKKLLRDIQEGRLKI